MLDPGPTARMRGLTFRVGAFDGRQFAGKQKGPHDSVRPCVVWLVFAMAGRLNVDVASQRQDPIIQVTGVPACPARPP